MAYDGTETLIAHVELPKTRRVGKHGVDEIGKMECLSERCVAHLRRILDARVPLIATVAKRGAGFIAEVKRREDCELLTLTRANRDAMPQQLRARLEPSKR